MGTQCDVRITSEQRSRFRLMVRRQLILKRTMLDELSFFLKNYESCFFTINVYILTSSPSIQDTTVSSVTTDCGREGLVGSGGGEIGSTKERVSVAMSESINCQTSWVNYCYGTAVGAGEATNALTPGPPVFISRRT